MIFNDREQKIEKVKSSFPKCSRTLFRTQLRRFNELLKFNACKSTQELALNLQQSLSKMYHHLKEISKVSKIGA